MTIKFDTMAEQEDYHSRLRARLDAACTERNALRAELDAIHGAIGAYTDSDLVSLATTMKARLDALEAKAEQSCAVCGSDGTDLVALCERCYEDRIA